MMEGCSVWVLGVPVLFTSLFTSSLFSKPSCHDIPILLSLRCDKSTLADADGRDVLSDGCYQIREERLRRKWNSYRDIEQIQGAISVKARIKTIACLVGVVILTIFLPSIHPFFILFFYILFIIYCILFNFIFNFFFLFNWMHFFSSLLFLILI